LQTAGGKIIGKTEIISVKRMTDLIEKETSDMVVNEEEVNLFLGNRVFKTFYALPENLKELCTGFLLTSGYIPEDSCEFDIINTDCCNFFLKKSPIIKGDRKTKNENVLFEPDILEIYDLMERFNNLSCLFRKTGGVHSAGLSEKGEIVVFCEDISRLNSLDKCIGKAFLRKTDFNKVTLFLSCRINLEIMKKIINVGIKAVVSKSAVSSKAVEAAQKERIFLAGFVRGKTVNIYSE